jgi:hypothetical protein
VEIKSTVNVIQEMKAAVRASKEQTKTAITPFGPKWKRKSRIGRRTSWRVDQQTQGLLEELAEIKHSGTSS